MSRPYEHHLGPYSALVLLSGGLDSTVLLHYALSKGNQDPSYKAKVVALNAFYGQKHNREREMARWTCDKLGVELIETDLSEVFKFDTESTLLKSGGEIAHESYADQLKKAEGNPVNTYVPYRNGLLISYAASVAYQLHLSNVYYGAHLDDAAGNAYPDCTEKFATHQSLAVREGTNGEVVLEYPYLTNKMTKKDIVKMGLELGMTDLDFTHTWSCYEGGKMPCHVCGTCRDREAAFEANGMKDPLTDTVALVNS